MTKDLTDQVVIVTGASSGIGEACARFFGREGCRVVLAARRMGRLEAIAEEIRLAGGSALAVQTDVSCLDEIENLVRTVYSTYGQVDILVNNAGFGRLNWLDRLDPIDDIRAILAVNLEGAIQLTRQVLPDMIRRRSGHIINIASVASWLPAPLYSLYAATKFGLRGFSEALRREVQVFGVNVSVVYPGPVETEFTEHIGSRDGKKMTTPRFLVLSADQVARVVVSLAKRPRRKVIMPWFFIVAIWGNTLLPRVVDWVVRILFTRKDPI